MRIVMLHAEAITGPPENASAIFQHYGHCEAGAPSKAGCMEYNTYITKGDGAAVTYVSRAVQFHPHGGQSDFVWLSAHTPHGGASYVW